MRTFLKLIRSGAITDDANLTPLQATQARTAYRKGLLTALPVEGSDAYVEALYLTEEGRAWLDLPQPRRG